MNNIFNLKGIDFSNNKEIIEIVASSKNVRIERIISTGQTTELDFWYEQTENEFVIILQGDAKILFDDGNEIHLFKGDYLTIPTRCRHKVSYTSANPACIWLAVFF